MPMPGSPASRATVAGTSPPPRTRSMPVQPGRDAALVRVRVTRESSTARAAPRPEPAGAPRSSPRRRIPGTGPTTARAAARTRGRSGSCATLPIARPYRAGLTARERGCRRPRVGSVLAGPMVASPAASEKSLSGVSTRDAGADNRGWRHGDAGRSCGRARPAAIRSTTHGPSTELRSPAELPPGLRVPVVQVEWHDAWFDLDEPGPAERRRRLPRAHRRVPHRRRPERSCRSPRRCCRTPRGSERSPTSRSRSSCASSSACRRRPPCTLVYSPGSVVHTTDPEGGMHLWQRPWVLAMPHPSGIGCLASRRHGDAAPEPPDGAARCVSGIRRCAARHRAPRGSEPIDRKDPRWTRRHRGRRGRSLGVRPLLRRGTHHRRRPHHQDRQGGVRPPVPGQPFDDRRGPARAEGLPPARPAGLPRRVDLPGRRVDQGATHPGGAREEDPLRTRTSRVRSGCPGVGDAPSALGRRRARSERPSSRPRTRSS